MGDTLIALKFFANRLSSMPTKLALEGKAALAKPPAVDASVVVESGEMLSTRNISHG
jgi:hypothetical protein